MTLSQTISLITDLKFQLAMIEAAKDDALSSKSKIVIISGPVAVALTNIARDVENDCKRKS